MITRSDVMPTNYYKKEPFTGSFRGMRYMLRKKETEEKKVFLEAIIWPQPFCFEKTPEEKKEARCFSFDEPGIQDALDWLNETYNERAEEYMALQSGL